MWVGEPQVRFLNSLRSPERRGTWLGQVPQILNPVAREINDQKCSNFSSGMIGHNMKLMCFEKRYKLSNFFWVCSRVLFYPFWFEGVQSVFSFLFYLQVCSVPFLFIDLQVCSRVLFSPLFAGVQSFFYWFASMQSALFSFFLQVCRVLVNRAVAALSKYLSNQLRKMIKWKKKLHN